jgi:predicted nuclease with TOPRIM domain
MKYQFKLTPTTLDKLKGNVVQVKLSELNKFADTFKEIVEENDKLKEVIEQLETEKENLNKELNQKILNSEIGTNNYVSKIENENEELKDKIDRLTASFKAMETLYLEEIKKLSQKVDNTNISKVIKDTLKSEFEKLDEPVANSFEIRV